MAESINHSRSLPSLPQVRGEAHGRQGTAGEQEARLLAGIRAGDAQAFASLVRQYNVRMLAVAGRFLHHDEDRADAVQDAFLAAYRSIPSFEGRLTLWTWLCRVLINTCLATRRSRMRPRAMSLNGLPQCLGGRRTRPPRQALERACRRSCGVRRARAQVRGAIKRLPGLYRDVLMLRDIEGLDTDQTAQRLGTSRDTVKTRLHRARQALRSLLEPMLCMQA